MSDVIAEYMAKLAKKNGRGKCNLPALARKDKDFMSCFLPDPDHVFVSQDIVSLEPSITAEMSGDPMYRYATLDGIGKAPFYNKAGVLMIDDIYLMSASVFPATADKLRDIVDNHTMPTGRTFCEQWIQDGIDGTEVCKDYSKKTVRNFAKIACLGIGYGMGWKKFQKTCEENGTIIDTRTAKATIKAYWDLFEGLKALRDTLSWQAKREGAIVNPFGYRITPEPHKAMNAYIQSSASGVLDVFNLYLFDNRPYIKFVAIIHDELIVQVHKNDLERFKADSKTAEQQLNGSLGWSVPIRFGFREANNFWDIKS